MNRDLKRALDKGITVEELIEELQQFNAKAKVVFEYQSSDYWKTRIARVVETVNEGDLKWSDYHNLPAVRDADDEDDERGDDNSTNVVVLNLGE